MLLLAFHIFFKTRDFEEEYRRKADQIRARHYQRFSDELENIIETREARRASESDELLEVDPFDEVEATAGAREAARDVDEWTSIIEDGKRILRRIGVSLGITAAAILMMMISFTVTGSVEVMLSVAYYSVLFPGVLTVVFAGAYIRLTRKLDEEFVSLKHLGGKEG